MGVLTLAWLMDMWWASPESRLWLWHVEGERTVLLADVWSSEWGRSPRFLVPVGGGTRVWLTSSLITYQSLRLPWGDPREGKWGESLLLGLLVSFIK